MRYRIDHQAWRTPNRQKTVDFFINALGYRVQETFELYFNDEKTETAICTALEPSDRVSPNVPFSFFMPFMEDNVEKHQKYVLSPEIFVSEGSPGSIVDEWCKKKGGAQLHHVALQIPYDSTVEQEVQLWLEKGWCEEFSSENVIKCDEMSQIFTKPSESTGVIWELIQRKDKGFCKNSVIDLMRSTKGD
jgi:hypothetical protein